MLFLLTFPYSNLDKKFYFTENLIIEYKKQRSEKWVIIVI